MICLFSYRINLRKKKPVLYTLLILTQIYGVGCSQLFPVASAPSTSEDNGSMDMSTGLKATQLALLVNDNDPDSVETAAYYQSKRNIPDENIVHLHIPLKNSLSRTEFAAIKLAVDEALSSNVQAIAIAWTQPSRVECNSITSAISRGFMSGPCDAGGSLPTCGFGAYSSYYNSKSTKPFTDFAMRPSMMLAGKTLSDVKALIDRGVASDFTNPTGQAHIMNTRDSTRSLRAKIYSSVNLGFGISPSIFVDILNADYITGTTDTLFYFQGLASVDHIADNQYPPGAVADHLTSFGGYLEGGKGQMSSLDWISGGLTGTFGTVSEPCAYSVKFPDPAIMMTYYTGGETLIEAYWKSIFQTFQGLFVGEPLANPWKH